MVTRNLKSLIGSWSDRANWIPENH